jgi:hypothetical protein
MLLRSGLETNPRCRRVPRRVRTKRQRHLPYLPIDVQREIFSKVPDLELFIKGDLQLQHYLIKHDMLREPQLCLAWAARQGHATLVHLLLGAGIEPSPHTLKMAGMGGHVFKRFSGSNGALFEYYLNRGEFGEAVRFYDSAHDVPDRTFENALRRRLFRRCEPLREADVSALLRLWPGAKHSFVYWGADRGLPGLLQTGLDAGGHGDMWGGVIWNALEEGHADCAEILIRSGTEEITFESFKGPRAFRNVCKNGHIEALRFALRYVRPSQNELDDTLEDAADAGRTGVVDVLLQHGGHPREAAIFAAASGGHLETYRTLVAAELHRARNPTV